MMVCGATATPTNSGADRSTVAASIVRNTGRRRARSSCTRELAEKSGGCTVPIIACASCMTKL